MPRKIREIIKELMDAGFYEIRGGGKGSHRKFTHARFHGAVTISGQTGDDAKPYQERQVKRASEEVLIMKPSDKYHKWVEWSAEDQIYLGKCPDLITGVHGDDPLRLYVELCEVVDDVIRHFESEGRPLPQPRVRPMQDVA